MKIRFGWGWLGALLLSSALFANGLKITKSGPNELIVEFETPEWTLKTVDQADGVNSRIEVPGLSERAREGAPALPVLSRFLSIAKGKTPRIVSLDAKTTVLSLPRRLAYSAPRRHCSGADAAKRITRDRGSFRLSRQLPFVTISPVSAVGPLRVSTLTIRPVQLLGFQRKLNVASQISVRIELVDTEDSAPAYSGASLSEESRRLFSSLVINPDETFLGSPTGETIDLIIAHDSYASDTSLKKLIEYKTSQGRRVSLKLLPKGNTAALKAVIEAEYKKTTPPTHTLLVGSIDQLPAFKIGSYWSDFPYSLLDAGNYPDLSIGRLPSRNGSELAQMVNKILRRETEGFDPGKVLMTSGYEVDWCQQNLAYIRKNIFDKSEVPLDITKLYASEGKKTDAVIDGYNANPNFIVYDGHGDEQGMTEIPLLREHLKRLTNKVHPIIFDIACLNSYWPSGGASGDNFAHSIMALPEYGVAGIFAASYYSGGHDLFRAAFRAFIFDENTSSAPFHRLREMGSIVLYGKLKYLEQEGPTGDSLADAQMFFYHGDPASRIIQ